MFTVGFEPRILFFWGGALPIELPRQGYTYFPTKHILGGGGYKKKPKIFSFPPANHMQGIYIG